ncbi:acyltransferase [Mesorhizobium sp. WSM3626]|uniref:acyltransferase family protein n=1 Tax=Mesorhizobium sp. WSM3626 TaxID=1040987 RepID=UPI0004B71A72|nr:acyltransferase [Mesorhizobium sp. WSM3626]
MPSSRSSIDGLRTDQLDGLRFLAFAMVFFFHFPAPAEYVSVVMVQRQGWVGVEIFFALSSFLLFRLFEQEQARAGRISISQFFVRRLLRIYPLMVLFPLAMLLVYDTLNPAAYGWLLGLASFVGNYIDWFPENGGAIRYTSQLWSLPYEFQIYLFLPFLFLMYLSIGKRALAAGLLCILPLCLLGRVAFALSGMSFQTIYMTPLLRPESTIVGILIAMGLTRKFPLPLVAAVFLLSGIGLVFLPYIHTPLGSVLAYLPAGLFAGSLLHIALYAQNVARLLRWPPLAYLGTISFGLYVFHAWSFDQGKALLQLTHIPENYATTCLAGLAHCVLAATLSYRVLEQPLLRLKPRRSHPEPVQDDAVAANA